MHILRSEWATVALAGLVLGLTTNGLDFAQSTERCYKPAAIWKFPPQDSRRFYVNLAAAPDGKRIFALFRLEKPVEPKSEQPSIKAVHGVFPAGKPADPTEHKILIDSGVQCVEVTEEGLRGLWAIGFAWQAERSCIPQYPARSLALSADGKYLAVGVYEGVLILHASSGEAYRFLSADLEPGVTDRHVKGLAFWGQKNLWLAGTYWGQVVHIWEVASGKTLARWQAWDTGCNQLLCTQFTEGGRVLAVAGIYPRIAFWNPLTGKRLGTWDVYDHKAGSETPIVYDLDTATLAGSTYWLSGHGDSLRGVFQDGQTRGVVEIRDHTGRIVYSRRVGGAVLGVALSPDGRWFASAEYVRSWKVRPVIPGQPIPRRPILDYFDWPSSISVWEVASGKLLGKLEGHEKGITDVVISPDARWVAACGDDGTIRLWRVPPRW